MRRDATGVLEMWGARDCVLEVWWLWEMCVWGVGHVWFAVDLRSRTCVCMCCNPLSICLCRTPDTAVPVPRIVSGALFEQLATLVLSNCNLQQRLGKGLGAFIVKAGLGSWVSLWVHLCC